MFPELSVAVLTFKKTPFEKKIPLAEIPSMVQEEASRPQFTPTGSNTSPQEAMQCDHGILDKRRPQQYAFRLKLSPHQLKTNKNQPGSPKK